MSSRWPRSSRALASRRRRVGGPRLRRRCTSTCATRQVGAAPSIPGSRESDHRFRDDADHPTPLIWFANGHVAIPRTGARAPAGRGPAGGVTSSRLLDGTSRSLGVAVAGTFGADHRRARRRARRQPGQCRASADARRGCHRRAAGRVLVLGCEDCCRLCSTGHRLRPDDHSSRFRVASRRARRSRDRRPNGRATTQATRVWRGTVASPGPAAGRARVSGPCKVSLDRRCSSRRRRCHIRVGICQADGELGPDLQDTGNVALMADTPWLAPAVAIFVVVLSLNLLGARAEHALFEIRAYFIPLVTRSTAASSCHQQAARQRTAADASGNR